MSAFRLVGVMAVATAAAAGCAAAPAESTQSDEGAMTSFSAERSPIDNGHYASDDGKTLLLLTSVGNSQRASLYMSGKIVETDVDVSTMSGTTISYRFGAASCDDHLHYEGARGIRIAGTCAEPTDLFSDNEAITGMHTSGATTVTVTATKTGLTLDVKSGSARANGIAATWTSAIEARGAAGACGTVAIVFSDREHATAYWADAADRDASCPQLPVYPTTK